MYGKILKISNNDLYGNVDDRKVVLFATFIHKKYMNKYAIFTFMNEYNKNKLYLASIHLKENSIVTFSVRNDEIPYINTFTTQLINNQIDPNEYEIIDISNINKVELVSHTAIDFDNLITLDNLTIPKEKVEVTETTTQSKPVFLYLLLAISILTLVGVIYLHYNPNALDIEYDKLDCTMSSYDEKVDLPYVRENTLKFDNRKQLKSSYIIDTYTFNDREIYDDFKNNNKESTYFSVDGTFKYDDDNLTLKVMYDEIIIITDYNEILRYMEKTGYDCVKGKYSR